MGTRKRTSTFAPSTFKRQKILSKPRRDQSPWRRAPQGGIQNVSKFVTMGQQERKFLDNNITLPATTVATGVLTLLNGCAQGTTAITRVGTRIYMKSVHIRMNLSVNVPTSASTAIRCLVVYDKESNGAAPLATDILAQDTSCAANNLYRPGRFTTLMDEFIHPMNGNACGYFIDRYVKIGLPVLFNSGNAGTVADISSGAVYVLINTNSMAYTNITGNTNARIRYTDA